MVPWATTAPAVAKGTDLYSVLIHAGGNAEVIEDPAAALATLYRMMVRIRAFENAAETASQGGVSAFGLRPMVEMRVVDFALCAMDELVSQAAKNRFMFGGQGRVPMAATR